MAGGGVERVSVPIRESLGVAIQTTLAQALSPQSVYLLPLEELMDQHNSIRQCSRGHAVLYLINKLYYRMSAYKDQILCIVLNILVHVA